ncbi:T9SS type A sorting domain-containing protein [Ekhidna sp.]
MKSKSTILALAFLLSMTCSAIAQDDDNKIVVEITKEINGEKKTFNGEYNSTEEMKADPQYQEFAGDEDGFNFWFDSDSGSDVFLHLDQLKNRSGSGFNFFHGDDDEDDSNIFFFKNFDSDSSNSFFDIHLDGMDLEEYKEKMKELGIEMDMLFDKLDEANSSKRFQVITMKRIKITDVGDEFGKKGRVDKNEELELEDLVFYPNPSPNGRFKVRFQLPEEGELSIKVSNLEGKEVFSRYFERFGGTYSETIDLSGQKEGIYLLEIAQGKNRVTKKVVIK